jgi:hypothetical protein
VEDVSGLGRQGQLQQNPPGVEQRGDLGPI